MKPSAFLVISLTLSLIDSQLVERFRLPPTVSIITSGLGERFVDETGGDDDDWTSESFSLSLALLLVKSVMERLIKFNPEDDEDDASTLGFGAFSAFPFVNAFVLKVCRNHGKSL